MSHFASLTALPEDPIFASAAAFASDCRKEKVNLGIGIYKDTELKTPVLTCVKQAEKTLLEKEEGKGYLPVAGDPGYLESIARIFFGSGHFAHNALQTPGGTGALRIGAELLFAGGYRSIYIPNPSWANHRGIFEQAGLQVHTYPYYDARKGTTDFTQTIAFLEKHAKGQVVLFHAGCHNPSGEDPDRSSWELLSEICKKENILPFFDAAYLGFCNSPEEDAFALRLFAERNLEFLSAVSLSKNFALYGERVGALFICSESTTYSAVRSVSVLLARKSYSNPPLHGSSVVSLILADPFLTSLWKEELLAMRQRIFEIRNNFLAALEMAKVRSDYSRIRRTNGLFFLSNLSFEQIVRLQKDRSIYLTEDGRINVTGLNESNLAYTARAIAEVGG